MLETTHIIEGYVREMIETTSSDLCHLDGCEHMRAAANKRQSYDGGQSKIMLELDTSDRNKVRGAMQSVHTPFVLINTKVSSGSEPRLKLDAHPHSTIP